MHATDFVFNGQRASDFGLFVGGIDVDDTTSGGDLSLNSVRAPGSDIFVNFSSAFDEPLEFTIPVVKMICGDINNVYFDQYEESAIAKWLLQRQGYKWLTFDQEGYEDIYYEVMCTSLMPQQIAGKTIGFNIVFTSNCAYGFSKEFNRAFSINSNNSYSLNIKSDVDSYILPKINIVTKNKGIFAIENIADINQPKTELKAINEGVPIELDCVNGIVDGILTPNDFNYYFPRLVSGMNVISTDSSLDIKMKITYREPRRVIV